VLYLHLQSWFPDLTSLLLPRSDYVRTGYTVSVSRSTCRDFYRLYGSIAPIRLIPTNLAPAPIFGFWSP